MVFQLICPDQTKSLTITRNFEISSALFIIRVKIICAHVICQTTPVEVCNPNTCCVRSNFFFWWSDDLIICSKTRVGSSNTNITWIVQLTDLHLSKHPQAKERTEQLQQLGKSK